MVPIKSGQPRQSFFIFESAVALVSGFACSPPPVLCLPLSLSNAAHTPTHARTFSPSFYHQLSRTRDHQSLLQKTVEREEEEEEEEETEKKRVASMGIKGMIDLEKHYSFYGAYHRHRVNVLMHTLFVWPLFFSFLVLFYFTPPIFSLFLSLLPENLLTSHGLVLNFGFLLALIYAVTYVCLDWKAGSLAALLCFAFWVGASLLAQQLGFSLAWKFFLASQVICWAGQSIGHGVFEKRAPSSNMAQAFVMAPYFVLLEVLQTICGYEPYPGFNRSVELKIEAEMKQWQSKAPSKKDA